MSLLRQIQDLAVDPTMDVGTLLRKTKILAARLQSADLAKWLDSELNGYSSEVSLPKYRTVPALVYATLTDGFTTFPKMAVFTSLLPERFKLWGDSSEQRGPIVSYADMLKNTPADEGVIAAPWPQELAVKFGREGYRKGLQCLSAWQEIPRGAIVGMVDSVRNSVLDFALNIEAKNPEAGEVALTGPPPIPNEVVHQSFSTIIMGGNNNVVSGGHGITQTHSGVTAGDMAALLGRLAAIGVPQSALAELRTSHESAPDKKAAVETWFSKFSLSAATETVKATIPLAITAIQEFLKGQ